MCTGPTAIQVAIDVMHITRPRRKGACMRTYARVTRRCRDGVWNSGCRVQDRMQVQGGLMAHAPRYDPRACLASSSLCVLAVPAPPCPLGLPRPICLSWDRKFAVQSRDHGPPDPRGDVHVQSVPWLGYGLRMPPSDVASSKVPKQCSDKDFARGAHIEGMCQPHYTRGRECNDPRTLLID